MGQAKQRRLQVDLTSPERRADIARCVRSIEFPGSIGRCVEYALTGAAVLEVIGLPCRVVFGTMVYQCGPAATDVIIFAGPDGAPVISGDDFLGHAWIESGDDLIDFSAGDWRARDYLVTGDVVVLPRWTMAPPEFWWRPRSEGGPLRPGVAWYHAAASVPGNTVVSKTDQMQRAAVVARQRARALLESWRRGERVEFE